MRRGILAAALTFGAAFGATVAIAPAAGAEAELDVTVLVTNKGAYTASLCGFDWLGGRCNSGIKPGESTKFVVHPRSHEDLVWARVVPNRGGFDEQPTVAAGDTVCFVSEGTRNNPAVRAVDCA